MSGVVVVLFGFECVSVRIVDGYNEGMLSQDMWDLLLIVIDVPGCEQGNKCREADR